MTASRAACWDSAGCWPSARSRHGAGRLAADFVVDGGDPCRRCAGRRPVPGPGRGRRALAAHRGPGAHCREPARGPLTQLGQRTALGDRIAVMIIVYGADWCEDTRRSLRHLRRLGVPHHYRERGRGPRRAGRARPRSTAASAARRRSTWAWAASPLVEPDNDAITGALVEIEMLTHGDAAERLGGAERRRPRARRPDGRRCCPLRGRKRRAAPAALAAAAGRPGRRADRGQRVVPRLPCRRASRRSAVRATGPAKRRAQHLAVGPT